MYTQKYIDGTPVDPAYLNRVSRLVSGAAAAIDVYSEDELEAFASNKITEAEWLQRCDALESDIAKLRQAAKGPLCLADKLAILDRVKQLRAQLHALRLHYFQLVE